MRTILSFHRNTSSTFTVAAYHHTRSGPEHCEIYSCSVTAARHQDGSAVGHIQQKPEEEDTHETTAMPFSRQPQNATTCLLSSEASLLVVLLRPVCLAVINKLCATTMSQPPSIPHIGSLNYSGGCSNSTFQAQTRTTDSIQLTRIV